MTDCLNFGNPERPEVMWEFERAIAGLGVGLREIDVPVVSGNVSLYNETGDASIHPTPTIGMVGLLESRDDAVGMGLPAEGGEIVLLGCPRPQLGATTYARVCHGVEQGAPPKVHWGEERALLLTLRTAIRRGLVVAAHDAADGGLAVALAEMAIAGGRNLDLGDGVGCVVNVPAYPDPVARELYLFGETHGCAWVVVPTAELPDLLALAQELGCMARHCGAARGDRIVITDAHKQAAVDLSVVDARASWSGGFCDAIGLPQPPARP